MQVKQSRPDNDSANSCIFLSGPGVRGWSWASWLVLGFLAGPGFWAGPGLPGWSRAPCLFLGFLAGPGLPGWSRASWLALGVLAGPAFQTMEPLERTRKNLKSSVTDRHPYTYAYTGLIYQYEDCIHVSPLKTSCNVKWMGLPQLFQPIA